MNKNTIKKVVNEVELHRAKEVLTAQELLDFDLYIFRGLQGEYYRYPKVPNEEGHAAKAWVGTDGKIKPAIHRGGWNALHKSYLQCKTPSAGKKNRPDNEASLLKNPGILATFPGKGNNLWVLDVDGDENYWKEIVRLVREEDPDYPHIYESIGDKPGGHIYLAYPDPEKIPAEDRLPEELYTDNLLTTYFESYLDYARMIYLPGAGNYLKQRPDNWKMKPFMFPTKAILQYAKRMYGMRKEYDDNEKNELGKATEARVRAYGETKFTSCDELKRVFETFESFVRKNIITKETPVEELEAAGERAKKVYADYISGTVAETDRLSQHAVDSFWSTHPPLHRICGHVGVVRGERKWCAGVKSPQHWGTKRDKNIPVFYKMRLDAACVTLSMDPSIDKLMLKETIFLLNNLAETPIDVKRLMTEVLNQSLSDESGVRFVYDQNWRDRDYISRFNSRTGDKITAFTNVTPNREDGGKGSEDFIFVNEAKGEFLKFSSINELDQKLAQLSKDKSYKIALGKMVRSRNNDISLLTRPMCLISDIYETPGITYPDNKEELSEDNPVILNRATRRPLLEIIKNGEEALPDGHELKGVEIIPEKHHPTIDMFMKHIHMNGPGYAKAADWVEKFLAIKIATGMYTPVGLFYIGVPDAGKNLFQDIILKPILGLNDMKLLHKFDDEHRICAHPTVIRPVRADAFIKDKQDWSTSIIVRFDEITGDRDKLKLFYETFKRATGEVGLEHRPLYTNTKQVKNRILFLLTANSDKNFPIDSGERRLAIFHPQKRIKNRASQYYKEKGVKLPQEWYDQHKDYTDEELESVKGGKYLEMMITDVLNELEAKCLSWHKIYTAYKEKKLYIDMTRPEDTPLRRKMRMNTTATNKVGIAFSDPVKTTAHWLHQWLAHDVTLIQSICATACLVQDNKVEVGDEGEYINKETTDLVFMSQLSALIKVLKLQNKDERNAHFNEDLNRETSMRIMLDLWSSTLVFEPSEEHYGKVHSKESDCKVKVPRLYKPGLADALRAVWRDNERDGDDTIKDEDIKLPGYLSDDPKVLSRYITGALKDEERELLKYITKEQNINTSRPKVESLSINN